MTGTGDIKRLQWARCLWRFPHVADTWCCLSAENTYFTVSQSTYLQSVYLAWVSHKMMIHTPNYLHAYLLSVRLSICLHLWCDSFSTPRSSLPIPTQIIAITVQKLQDKWDSFFFFTPAIAQCFSWSQLLFQNIEDINLMFLSEHSIPPSVNVFGVWHLQNSDSSSP